MKRALLCLFPILLFTPATGGAENTCNQLIPSKDTVDFISSFDIFKKAISKFRANKFSSAFNEFVKALDKLKNEAKALFQSKKCRQEAIQKFLAKYTRGEKPLLLTKWDVFIFHPAFYRITAYSSCMAKKPHEGLRILLEAAIDSKSEELINLIEILNAKSEENKSNR